MSYTLPELDYPYDALEPHIDAQTMEIHHSKHHAGYVDKLTAALEGHADLGKKNITDILANVSALPADIRTAVINNGGGHANHSLFWTIMGPNKGGKPTGDLAGALEQTFTSFSKFQDQFQETASTRFGSGWAWLTVDADDGLVILSTANQDSPLSQGLTPILGLDVWEHAYYLKYQNKRPDYITAWWNIVNWDEVERRYEEAKG